MGHYDDCYEADREASNKRRDVELERWLKEKIPSLSLEEKQFLHDVSLNIKDHMIFFKIIKQYGKKSML